MNDYELEIGDWIQYVTVNGQSHFGKVASFQRYKNDNELYINLNLLNGKSDSIPKNWDWVKAHPNTANMLDEKYNERNNQSNDVQQRKRNAPPHYEGEVDFLDYFFMQATPDEMRGAMKFTIGRYATRLGRKDDEIKELDKIIDYAQRYKEKLTE